MTLVNVRSLIAACFAALALTACGAAPDDYGTPDDVERPQVEAPAVVDAGTPADDLAQGEGTPDAGTVDAGEADAGTVEVDAGTPDAGAPAPFLRITSGRFPGGVGAVATLTWESSGVEAVRAEYTLDTGRTWKPLPGAESLPASAGGHTFTVPRDAGWQNVAQHWSQPSPARVRVVALDGAALSSEVEANTGCALPTLTEVQWPDYSGRGGFVELVNHAPWPINLDGFLLATDPYRHTGPAPFPAGTVIPAKGVLVLYDSASAPPVVPEGVTLVAATTPTVAPLGMFALDAVCASWSNRSSTGSIPAFDPRLTSDEQKAAWKGPGVAVSRYVDARGGVSFTWTAQAAGLSATPGADAHGKPFAL